MSLGEENKKRTERDTVEGGKSKRMERGGNTKFSLEEDLVRRKDQLQEYHVLEIILLFLRAVRLESTGNRKRHNDILAISEIKERQAV